MPEVSVHTWPAAAMAEGPSTSAPAGRLAAWPMRPLCISWMEIFSDERKRRGILACFLAMLELVKMEKVFVRQEGNLGPIMVYKKEVRADVADASAVT